MTKNKFCHHNKRRSRCKKCKGSEICKHNRIRTVCKDCHGGAICEHNNYRDRCKACKGSQICEHDKVRYACIRCCPRSVYILYRHSAAKRKQPFEMTVEQFLSLLKLPCCFCGGESGGVDQITAGRGYVEGNIQPCCAMCNYMKLDYSEQEFIQQALKIAEYRRIKIDLNN